MRRKSIHRLASSILIVSVSILLFAFKTCSPENMLVTIVTPPNDAVIHDTRADIRIALSPEVDRETFSATLNGRDISERFEITDGWAVALDVPIRPGGNELVATGALDGPPVSDEERVTFSAGPPPEDVRNTYLTTLPIDLSALDPNLPVLSLTFLLKAEVQDGFYANGTARLLAVNDKVLAQPPREAPMQIEVLGSELWARIASIEIPLDTLLAFIIEPIEAETGEDIDLEEIVPVVSLDLSGQVLDEDGDGRVEGIDGELVAMLLNETIPVPASAPFHAPVFEKRYDTSGPEWIETHFEIATSEGNIPLSFTYYVDLTQNDVGISGAARLVKVNDTVLTRTLPPTDLYGTTVNERIAMILRAFQLDSIEPLVAYLATYGLDASQLPAIEIAYLGDVETDEEGRVLGHGGEVTASLYGAAMTLPAFGRYEGRPYTPDTFTGPRLYETAIDLSAFGVAEPVRVSLCSENVRSDTRVLGAMRAFTFAGKTIDMTFSEENVSGNVVGEDLAVRALSLAADNEENLGTIEQEIEGMIEGLTGEDVEISLPASIPLFDIDFRGTLAPEGDAAGSAQGILFGTIPVVELGTFQAPVIPETRDTTGAWRVAVTIDLSGLGIEQLSTVTLPFDLDLRQEGCSLTGGAEFRVSNAPRVPEGPFAVRGVTDGERIEITIFDIPLEDYLQADLGLSGPLVDISLVGTILASDRGVDAISGDATAGLLFDTMTFAFGTFEGARP